LPDRRDDADLTLLINAARQAGDIALRHFRNAPRHWEKADGAGPVTVADLEVDAYLHDRLLAARPDFGWLSEETADNPARLDRDAIFIVDPIDGTRGFMAGDAGWCIALAVVRGGAVTASVAWLAAKDVLYAARVGGGATRNGTPIEPSDRADPRGGLFLTGAAQMEARHWPGGAPSVRRAFRPSLVHRLCLVAAGEADATLTFRPAWEWDIAPGALIAAEAGCAVTDGDGGALRFNAPTPRLPGVMVAPGPVHRALMRARAGDTRAR
jgi:myo-inositol-1(or 4)-monophosphatase